MSKEIITIQCPERPPENADFPLVLTILNAIEGIRASLTGSELAIEIEFSGNNEKSDLLLHISRSMTEAAEKVRAVKYRLLENQARSRGGVDIVAAERAQDGVSVLEIILLIQRQTFQLGMDLLDETWPDPEVKCTTSV